MNVEVKADDGRHAPRLEKVGTGGWTHGGALWEVKKMLGEGVFVVVLMGKW